MQNDYAKKASNSPTFVEQDIGMTAGKLDSKRNFSFYN